MARLSQIHPDFVALVEQFREALNTADSWKDLLESSTGQTLIEFLSGIGTHLHYTVERGVQEVAGFESAQLASSVYALSRFLGINPASKKSAKVTVSLSVDTLQDVTFSISEFSQFEIEGIGFYNPEAIRFPVGTKTVTDITLKQGEVISGFVTTGARPYEAFTFSQSFEAADDVMQVSISNTDYTRERRSLWGYDSDDTVFLEQTLIDGSVRVQFGDGNFGKNPDANQQAVITYIQTDGPESNKAQSGFDVTLTDTLLVAGDEVQITGTTTSSISGGQDEQATDQLRVVSPRLFAAGDRAVRDQDYEVIALTFPDRSIVDAHVWGEHEIDSEDSTNMNVVNMTVLPTELDTLISDWTGDGSTTSFSATLGDTPIAKKSVRIEEEHSDGVKVYADNGSGTILEDGSTTNRGSIDYTTGELMFSPAMAPEDDAEIEYSYQQLGLSDSEQTSFKSYLNGFMHVTTILRLQDLSDTVVDIELTIHHDKGYHGSQIATEVEQKIRGLFKPRFNLLGRDFELSDYIRTATSVEGVDYVTLTSPTAGTNVGRNGFVVLGDLSISFEETDR